MLRLTFILEILSWLIVRLGMNTVAPKCWWTGTDEVNSTLQSAVAVSNCHTTTKPASPPSLTEYGYDTFMVTHIVTHIFTHIVTQIVTHIMTQIVTRIVTPIVTHK